MSSSNPDLLRTVLFVVTSLNLVVVVILVYQQLHNEYREIKQRSHTRETLPRTTGFDRTNPVVSHLASLFVAIPALAVGQAGPVVLTNLAVLQLAQTAITTKRLLAKNSQTTKVRPNT